MDPRRPSFATNRKQVCCFKFQGFWIPYFQACRNRRRLSAMCALTIAQCMRLSKSQLYPLVFSEVCRQSQRLEKLRIRRKDLLNTYAKISSDTLYGANIEKWRALSYDLLSASFDSLVADGKKFGGQLSNNLEPVLNEICSHIVHTLMLLQMLDSENPFEDINLASDVRRVHNNVSALAREKFGVCPELRIVGCHNIIGSPSLIEYTLVELLKNAIKAVIDRYGALQVEDAEPIVVDITDGVMRITDAGVGMENDTLRHIFDAFYTTQKEDKDPSYHYSRDFGVPFNGCGFGLLKSKVARSNTCSIYKSFCYRFTVTFMVLRYPLLAKETLGQRFG